MGDEVSVSGPDPERPVIGPKSLGLTKAQPVIVLGLAAGLLGNLPLPARAANLFASGDQARQLCTESQEWCVGFVTGALDGWAALEAYYDGEKFCLPPDLTAGQIVESFRQELDRRPEPRDDPAAYVLYERLVELFPCAPAPDPLDPELEG